MKVRYVGKSFGADSLTNGKVYEVLEICEVSGGLRIVDDSGYEEGYLYDPISPKPNGCEKAMGRFEIVEDDAIQSLHKAIEN